MKNSHTKCDNLPFFNTHSHTDLACECIKLSDKCNEIISFEYEKCGYTLKQTEITGKNGELHSGKKAGKYLSLYAPEMKHPELAKKDEISTVLSEILLEFIRGEGIALSDNTNILIAGLGNRNITADAIGPKTADKILATAHLNRESKSFRKLKTPNLSVISPGVCSDTGIEAAQTISSLSRITKADLIIAIDALCARSPDRLCTTIQLSTVGIQPGSGIGNKRTALTYETIGIPVIAIGIPTVISAGAFICEALRLADMEKPTPELEESLRKNANFFVSHGESDSLISISSDIIAEAIEKALIPTVFAV